ncbi:hypothetical protein JCM19238_1267 [Vibrio ponticus]|nr:hypothetical protein JCM19238_1267 [Vibrio ponticus]
MNDKKDEQKTEEVNVNEPELDIQAPKLSFGLEDYSDE